MEDNEIYDSGIIVIDTNFFISHLNFFKSLVDLGERYNLIIIIPFIVLQELDGLKMSKKLKDSDHYTLIKAISKICDYVQEGHPVIRGQTREEVLKEEKVNDDKILDCCLYFQTKVFPETLMTLLTGDKMLITKAMIHNINYMSVKNIEPETFLINLGKKNKDKLWLKQPQNEADDFESESSSPPKINYLQNQNAFLEEDDEFPTASIQNNYQSWDDMIDEEETSSNHLSNRNQQPSVSINLMENTINTKTEIQRDISLGHSNWATKSYDYERGNYENHVYLKQQEQNHHTQNKINSQIYSSEQNQSSGVKINLMESFNVYKDVDVNHPIEVQNEINKSYWSTSSGNIQIDDSESISEQKGELSKSYSTNTSNSVQINNSESTIEQNDGLSKSYWASTNNQDNIEVESNYSEPLELSIYIKNLNNDSFYKPGKMIQFPITQNYKYDDKRNQILALLCEMINYVEREVSTILNLIEQKETTGYYNFLFILVKLSQPPIDQIFEASELAEFSKYENLFKEYYRLLKFGLCSIFFKDIKWTYDIVLIIFKLFQACESDDKLQQRAQIVQVWLEKLEKLQ